MVSAVGVAALLVGCFFISDVASNRSDVQKVVSIVKIFDATKDAVPFCNAPPPYAQGAKNAKNGISTSIDLALNGNPFASIASQQTKANGPKKIEFPKFLEDLILQSLVQHISRSIHDFEEFDMNNEMDLLRTTNATAALSEFRNTLSGVKETILENFITQFGDLTPSSPTGRRLTRAVKNDDDQHSATLMDLLVTQFLAYTVDCLVANTQWSIRPFPPSLSIDLVGSHDNLGQCLCRAWEWGGHRGDTHADGCAIMNFLEGALSCSEGGPIECSAKSNDVPASGFPSCKPPHFGPSKSNDPNVDYDLYLHPRADIVPDGSPMPQFIDKSVVNDEGLTYYYLFRANIDSAKYAYDSLCGAQGPNKKLEIVPGWKTALYIDAKEEGDIRINTSGRGSIPLVIVSRRKCDLLIVIRGTSSSFEWRVDFTYNQVPANLTGLGNLPSGGMYHNGYTSIMGAVLPAVESYIGDYIGECAAKSPRVIVTGHSLGGGVATIISHVLARKLAGIAKVSAVLFAPPQALTAETADDFDKLVNTRSLKSELDPIAALPCRDSDVPNGFVLCPHGDVKTGPADKLVWYRAVKGVIPISYDDLATMSGDERWRSTATASLNVDYSISESAVTIKGELMNSANLQFDAYHVCSYGCWTGQFCRDPNVSQWTCSDNDKNVQKCNFMSYSINHTIPIHI